MSTSKQSSIVSSLAIATVMIGVGVGASRNPAWGIAPRIAEPQTQESSTSAPLPPGVTRVPVTFSGGYDTDPRDRGRPVILIAAALGVPSEVFREAFTHVTPARPGNEPEPNQVRANKAALLGALGKYGVTNDRLDTVSNYYRYPPGRVGRWRTAPAVANALVKDGAVVGFEIVSGGSGYTTPPMISIPGIPGAHSVAKLAFGKRMESNGAISAITVSSTPNEGGAPPLPQN